MAKVTKPIMTDETGQAIVAAIQSTDVAQVRIAEINQAAEAKKQEVLESIPDDYTDLSADVTQLKGDLVSLDGDIGLLATKNLCHIYGTYEVGTLVREDYSTWVKYRVFEKDIISFEYDTVINIASGFRLGMSLFDSDGAYQNETGFKTGSYTMPKGQKFRFTIARETDDTSEVITNTKEFVNAVTIKPIVNYLIADNTKAINNCNNTINQNIVANRDLKAYLRFEFGTLGATGIPYTPFARRIYSNPIKFPFPIKIKIKSFVYDGNTYKPQLRVFTYTDELYGGATKIHEFPDASTIFTIEANTYFAICSLITINGIENYDDITTDLSLSYHYRLFEVLDNSMYDKSLDDEIGVLNSPIDNCLVSIAHQGYQGYGATGNTLGAFIDASKKGFSCIETDVQLTSDNVFVLCHDSSFTVNDTNYVIGDNTYETLKSAKSDLCTLEECLKVCKYTGMEVALDKIMYYSDDIIESMLIPLLKKYRMLDKCIFILWQNKTSMANMIQSYVKNAKICIYVAGFETPTLQQVQSFKTDYNTVIMSCNKNLLTDSNIEQFNSNTNDVKLWGGTADDVTSFRELMYICDYVDSDVYHAKDITN